MSLPGPHPRHHVHDTSLPRFPFALNIVVILVLAPIAITTHDQKEINEIGRAHV